MLAPTIALGVPALLGLVGFAYFSRQERTGPIVVVDNRTLKIATRRIDQAEQVADLAAATHGITAITCWLRREIHTGPARHRVLRARQLEQWELRRATITSEKEN